MLSLAPLLIALAASTAGADEEVFVSLFDGRTTEGWTPVGGQPGNWRVDDGRLSPRARAGAG